ncbi:hypothetical protein DEW08_21235 [Azospirillum thermophilum]|uniref:Uncharacterized protein n=1 Tax=Azospirillum thermophilum TaxID=2202148 RepID=A0A2S2CVV2_9PROT|nr:hypothetical protein DEW08_21235 [Azospirillum thermophilum]
MQPSDDALYTTFDRSAAKDAAGVIDQTGATRHLGATRLDPGLPAFPLALQHDRAGELAGLADRMFDDRIEDDINNTKPKDC